MARKLNAQQKRFCQEYIIDLNATQAAIRAEYSKKTAYSQGQRLLNHVEVQKELQRLMKKREKRTEVTADSVVKELAKIAFADITDFAEVCEIQRLATVDEKGNPHYETVQDVVIKDTDEMNPDKLGVIAGMKHGAHGIEIKLNDKMKALELLGRHLGLYTDNLNHKIEDFNINIVSTD